MLLPTRMTCPQPSSPPLSSGRQGAAGRVRLSSVQAGQRPDAAGEPGVEELLPAPSRQGGLQVGLRS